MKMRKALPCIMCGSTDIDVISFKKPGFYDVHREYLAICKRCGCIGSNRLEWTEDKAVGAWNKFANNNVVLRDKYQQKECENDAVV